MSSKKIAFAFIFTILMGSLSAQTHDSYYFSKVIPLSFEEATIQVKASLKKQGFGVITEIDMDKTLREKLDNIDMKPYKILGVCNPKFAHETLQAEENIGLFLPCKVLVKMVSDDQTEVVMVNPSALMKMLGNEALMPVADKVTDKFKAALEEL